MEKKELGISRFPQLNEVNCYLKRQIKLIKHKLCTSCTVRVLMCSQLAITTQNTQTNKKR